MEKKEEKTDVLMQTYGEKIGLCNVFFIYMS